MILQAHKNMFQNQKIHKNYKVSNITPQNPMLNVYQNLKRGI
jgi:hypothetical protein